MLQDFYIVYLGDSPVSKQSAVQKHISLLSSVKGSENGAKESIVHSYTKSFNAFAAKLSKDEAEMLKGLEEVASVFPNRYRKLHTTKSWDFIGLPSTARRNLKLERNIVVGLLDTAGNLVQDADLYGLAKGTARGAVPSARIATYKVCWASSGCADMDILAALDDATSDGCISCLEEGIITVTSAGNEGPSLSSVSNYSPWLLTVAASGINRKFMSTVKLGNGKSFPGIGINTFELKGKLYPIVSGADVAMNSESKEMQGIGGIGTVVESEQYLDTAQIFMAPATCSPSAVVYKSEEVKVPAHLLLIFIFISGSKSGLTACSQAPGVDILAAYTLTKSLTGLKGDTQHSSSLSCPALPWPAHICRCCSLRKIISPTWTPAAIKSAIMTTGNKDAEFAYGAGQLNPARAINPGLVYDIDEMSYVQFLCHEGYSGSSSTFSWHKIHKLLLDPSWIRLRCSQLPIDAAHMKSQQKP
ncbi:Xylem serine peptidase 1 isoform 2 [Hibiscus syriacus]|uniref:Xylem serine peptidase 1 isoform 2 n=1 Tax=Hibiscus syriacus TaxID=106335 RepID=A0A6A3CJR9_HIBSY|nr:Xylem serine peptidase 1 isoform 2 [Hibiscus syriacus]